MAKLPFEFLDSATGFLDSVSNASSSIAGRLPPTTSGSTSRQARIIPKRDAISTRQAMRFIVPEQPIVEMYINPQQISYNFKKLITPTRVKGGYVLQYWGEDLTSLTVNGTTGTSGIEGINVLRDVYRNEQLMFDPYALLLQAERDMPDDNILFGDAGPFGINDVPFLGDMLGTGIGFSEDNIINSRNKPTLASLAFTVEIYWMGEVFRGYFENFDYNDSAERLGLFNYNFSFKVTQCRGYRTNFLAWHHSPTNGQSNWRRGGPPLSYGTLVNEYETGRNPADQVSVFNSLKDINKIKLNELSALELIDAFVI